MIMTIWYWSDGLYFQQAAATCGQPVDSSSYESLLTTTNATDPSVTEMVVTLPAYFRIRTNRSLVYILGCRQPRLHVHCTKYPSFAPSAILTWQALSMMIVVFSLPDVGVWSSLGLLCGPQYAFSM